MQQLVSQGWLPREGRGEYDLAACLEGYAAYLEEVESRRGVGGAIDRARARKYRAQAEFRELELAVESGELLKQDEVIEDLGWEITTLRANLLNLPNLANRLAPADREERERILREELEHAVAPLEMSERA